jgi:hypothetical protein
MFGDQAGGWQLVGIRHVERFTVRHDAGASIHTEEAVTKRFGIDLQAGYPPIREVRRRKSELDRAIQKLVLYLKVLGREKHPLCPNHPMPVLHAGYTS